MSHNFCSVLVLTQHLTLRASPLFHFPLAFLTLVTHLNAPLFTLFSNFILLLRLIADKQLPAMCLQFASSMRTHLTSDSISGMFLSHLVYLCDTGLVSPACVTQCMDIVQQGQS